MDEVNLTQAQLRELAAKKQDITITHHHPELKMIYFERTRYRGQTDEAKWMKADGKLRD